MTEKLKADGLLLLRLATQMEEVIARLGKLESQRFRNEIEIYRISEAVDDMIDVVYYEEDREGEPIQ